MKNPFLIVFFLVLISLNANAQTRKEFYDKGVTYWEQEDYINAISYFDQSIAELEKAEGKDGADYLKTITELADLYRDKGWFEKASSYYEEIRALNLKHFGNTSNEYTATLQHLAVAYQNHGFMAKAEVLFNELETIYLLNKNNQEYPNQNYLQLMNSFYTLYKNQNLIKKAEDKIASLLERLNGYEPQTPSYYNHEFSLKLAELYLNQQRYKEAEEIISGKITLLEKKQEEVSRLNQYYDLAGYLYQEQNNPTRALLYFEKSLQQNKRLFKSNNRSYFDAYALALYRKATATENTSYAKSVALYEEALSISRVQLAKIHSDYRLEYSTSYMDLLLLIGISYTDHQRYTQAEKLLTEAVSLSGDLLGKNNYGTVVYLTMLARVYEATSQWEKATSIQQQASEILLNSVDKNFYGFSEKERQQFYDNRISYNFEYYTGYALRRINTTPELSGWIYNNRIATKGLLLQSTEKVRLRIMNSDDTELKNKFIAWRLKKNSLARMHQMPLYTQEEQNSTTQQLEEEINSLEKELSQKSELLATVASMNSRYTWQQVQKKLQDNEAAIEMIRFRKKNGNALGDTIQYAALIITKKSAYPEYVLLTNGNDMEGKHINYYRNTVKNKLPDPSSYSIFWKKIADKLTQLSAAQPIKTIYFSPDGVYQLISLNTLFNPASEKYLVDETSVQLVGSTKDLIIKKSTDRLPPSAVLLGFPDYNATPSADSLSYSLLSDQELPALDTTQRFLVGDQVTALPGTREEVNLIEKTLLQQRIPSIKLLGPNASEENIKAVKDPGVLHIATHGFFIPDLPSVDADIKNNTVVNNSNPLLRSGLLLAYCQSALSKNKTIATSEDGILTAYEAMNLNLDQTQLLVLSACETGLGTIKNGEGVYGLQRAFQQAGAKTILMSLWAVSDEATQQLMTAFYDYWLVQKQNKHEAFKNAQQQLKKAYPEPYFWGAFVMIAGD